MLSLSFIFIFISLSLSLSLFLSFISRFLLGSFLFDAAPKTTASFVSSPPPSHSSYINGRPRPRPADLRGQGSGLDGHGDGRENQRRRGGAQGRRRKGVRFFLSDGPFVFPPRVLFSLSGTRATFSDTREVSNEAEQRRRKKRKSGAAVVFRFHLAVSLILLQKKKNQRQQSLPRRAAQGRPGLRLGRVPGRGGFRGPCRGARGGARGAPEGAREEAEGQHRPVVARGRLPLLRRARSGLGGGL